MKWGLTILALGFSACLYAQNQADTTFKPVEYPTGYSAQLNVVYTNVHGWEGKVDLYLPPQANKPATVIINIHGGAWKNGVKESQGGFGTFFKAGFAVANIEYRLVARATAPAAIEDVRCALIYLIKNAKALNIDTTRIVIMGGSAGGHLALMAGLLGNDHRFDTNCPGVDNVQVLAIIDKYGITDVWDWAYGKNIRSPSAIHWLGNKATDSLFAASVSPIRYVSKYSPPTLLIHGDADPTVPYQHSVDLHAQLLALGVRTEFITVPGGLHGKFDREKNVEINTAIVDFIRKLY